MLVSHRIDDENQVIITTFAPEEANLKLFFEAFRQYQEGMKSRPKYLPYHELVDFRPITSINISAAELKEFGKYTSSADLSADHVTKLALLVDSKPAFTLAKVYEMIRNFTPESKKQVKVFRDFDDAMEWITLEVDTPVDKPA